MRTFRALLLAPVLLIFVVACSMDPGEQEHPIAGKFSSAEAGKPSVILDQNGALSGNDGCNNFTGQWSREGNEISLGLGAMTMMACPGVDTWLSLATVGTAGAPSLVLRDEAGRALGTLQRSE